MAKVKHSKIRNTGLLFEFLVRQITAEVLDKKARSKSIQIVKEKFNERTELGKELALYNIIATKKFKSDTQADYFINEVINQRGKLNNSALKREKYNLIKSLKESYDLQKFLSSKVNNYKIYASIYKLFEYGNSLPADEKTESHFNLVEHITTETNSPKLSESNALPKDESLRILAYRTLLEKFNEKYSNFNLSQKKLLKEYINNISNTGNLKEYIEKESIKIKNGLKKHKINLKDKVVKIKMDEAINSIDKMCGIDNKIVKDSDVVQTLRYMELLKELVKGGTK